MPVSSGRVDRRAKLKSKLLDSPGWVAATGNILSTPQSGFKKSNRRSTLFPDSFSPRRTRRQTIVMSLPLVDLCEEASEQHEQQATGDDIASTTVSSKRKEPNGTANSTSEIKVELMKAPSKRAVRSSAKSKKSKSSQLSPKPLPSVSEQPSNTRRSRGRPPKAGTKRTTRKKDKENVGEKGSKSQKPNGEPETRNEFELPSELEDFELPSIETKSRHNVRTDAQLTATPMLLLNRVDTNHQLSQKMKSNPYAASPPEDDNPSDGSLNDSKLADTSISSLNTSQAADRSGRCLIL